MKYSLSTQNNLQLPIFKSLNILSNNLYYRKLSANSPKGYLPATDDNSNCDERKILVFALFCVNKT